MTRSNVAQSLAMDVNLQPTLAGHLIDVRPLQLEDFDSLFTAASDPLIWEQHNEPDRYKRDLFQKFFDGAMNSKGALAVILRESGRIIGTSRYYNHNPQARQITIGFTFLERAYWGGTFNSELKRLMLDHAFQFVDEVCFEVAETNLRSQKALQKIGARFVRQVELESPAGDATPFLLFAITRTRWSQGRDDGR